MVKFGYLVHPKKTGIVMRYTLFNLLTFFFISGMWAQSDYWQQEANYHMYIVFNAEDHTFKGRQHIQYTNNSPDTLHRIYYHLYYNAFQPNSMMDVRSRTIPDPDKRIGDRISKLEEDEIGYHRIIGLDQDGEKLTYDIAGTILKVQLAKPIVPGGSSMIHMDFQSQVPVQIRRTGRNNIEGIDYSMSQWYPKLCEYDRRGWHANPYVAREYHGVWGNFEVEILMDSAYTVAATGVLQNPEGIGKGYGKKTTPGDSSKLKWHFIAENVHDFVWAADPDYIHKTVPMKDGPELHFFYQNDTAIIDNWETLPEYAVKCFNLMNKMVGEYPYPVYSVIQGGDGGMEYPMATLILGNGSMRGLVGVTVHEALHSWFQAVLASDEGYFPWMDEGFDTYYNHIVIDSLYDRHPEFTHKGSYSAYLKLLQSDKFEPISTHSDHYMTNRMYGTAAYAMGCVFLGQLHYIVGAGTFDKIMKRYYKDWKFKHPEPNDFMRIAEKESGMQLDWYFNYFIYTGRTIDYAVEEVDFKRGKAEIKLQNKGTFPMPLDVRIELKDGTVRNYNIPLEMMLDYKDSDGDTKLEYLRPWPWTHPTYSLELEAGKKDIVRIEIDPSGRLADVDRSNNVWPVEKKGKGEGEKGN